MDSLQILVLVYTNNTAVLMNSDSNIKELERLLTQFSLASNADINIEKLVLILVINSKILASVIERIYQNIEKFYQ